jgi:hypothetical protein
MTIDKCCEFEIALSPDDIVDALCSADDLELEYIFFKLSIAYDGNPTRFVEMMDKVGKRCSTDYPSTTRNLIHKMFEEISKRIEICPHIKGE